MAISGSTGYKEIVYKEVQMITQPTTQIIQWQDFKLMSEVDQVLKIAQEKRWKDCKIFGSGCMITQPLESKGWKLIPADLYEYSIPAKGVDRILQLVNAGVRIQGVIIADDKRHIEPPPKAQEPGKPHPAARTAFSIIGKVLIGLAVIAGVVYIGVAAGFGALLLAPMFFLSVLSFDPQLIILVDDGKGGLVWVSVLTWFD